MIAKAGSIDVPEHKGALFWLVDRTSKIGEANMSIEHLSADISVNLKVPGKKRKLSSDWSNTEAPTLEFLVNKKAIKQHTKLATFLPEVDQKPAKALKEAKAKA